MFYYIYDGLPEADKRQLYYLDNDVIYKYLSGCSRDASAMTLNQVKFKAVQKCFEVIGFRHQVRVRTQSDLVLAPVLMLT